MFVCKKQLKPCQKSSVSHLQTTKQTTKKVSSYKVFFKKERKMKGVDTCTIVAEEQQKQLQNITLAIQKAWLMEASISSHSSGTRIFKGLAELKTTPSPTSLRG